MLLCCVKFTDTHTFFPRTMGCNTRLCSRNLKLLWFRLEFHISILLLVLSPFSKIIIKYCAVPTQFTRFYIFAVKLTCSLLWITHFPWSCIPSALLSDINKVFCTLAVIKFNHLQSHTEEANALSGVQLYFSCVEKYLGDAVLLKQWDLWQGSDPIPAGTIYSALEKILSGGQKFYGKH